MGSSTAQYGTAALGRYIEGGHKKVDGWLSPLDAHLTALIAMIQAEEGVAGSVGEIGVHHGRLFIALALATKAGERAFAADLFAEQAANIDRSGEGDEAAFARNMARFQVDAARVDTFRGNSMDLKWPMVEGKVGARARLFSVDGGHTEEVAANDLRLADDGLHERGVVILDDYFNVEFPAVSVALNKVMFERPGHLAAFAIGDNKLFLCRPAVAAHYRDRLNALVADRFKVHNTLMFGRELAVFRTPRGLLLRIRQSALARRLRDHPVGRWLKPLVRRILQG
ncbi:class I SAM-dependent methyltransferase [Oleomonas cavernae]|uniref:Class I SAM-dependent methyltransferase n=1 Tax=Oleomonas cavernae TaxID=2320859 RepID=A0A418WGL1_9PROT|nr:class I SAM-dependent methyltransferase [Oleomonas cavernae]RJF89118.1 class I SAM-dependent methyltransferase [Oleomonas cavernae]